MRKLNIFSAKVAPIQHPKVLLMTSPHNLGDLVAKVPFIRLFKKQFPSCKLIVLCRTYVFPLARCIKEIDEILDFEVFFGRDEKEIIAAFKKLEVDTCLHILSTQNHRGPDVTAFAQKAGVPYRIGNRCQSKWTLLKKKNFYLTHNVRKKRILPQVHEFEWNLFPLHFFGIPLDLKEIDLPHLLNTEINTKEKPKELVEGKFNLILHPGSFGNAKEWPISHYIQLIEGLSETYNIILTGSLNEKKRDDFSSVQNKIKDLRGELSLENFIQLLKCADGLVAASTGPIHIASLFGTKTLGLFPKQTEIGLGVWGARGRASENIESKSICLSCLNRLTDLNSNLCTCMEGIEVSWVQEKIEQWRGLYENIV